MAKKFADTQKWLIWSNEHEMWWAPSSHGYVQQIERAGRYSWEEAMQICDDANDGEHRWKRTLKTKRDAKVPAEVMVPERDALEAIHG